MNDFISKEKRSAVECQRWREVWADDDCGKELIGYASKIIPTVITNVRDELWDKGIDYTTGVDTVITISATGLDKFREAYPAIVAKAALER